MLTKLFKGDEPDGTKLTCLLKALIHCGFRLNKILLKGGGQNPRLSLNKEQILTRRLEVEIIISYLIKILEPSQSPYADLVTPSILLCVRLDHEEGSTLFLKSDVEYF